MEYPGDLLRNMAGFNILNNENKQALQLVFGLLGKNISRQEYLDAMTDMLHTYTGMACVGIRILTRERYLPYESYVGFPTEFWEKENVLSVDRDQCACTRIFQKKPDLLAVRYMTEGGSFCCNDSRKMAAELDEEGKTGRYRGSCGEAGFLTVAVLPLVHREQTVGVLHLADYQPDKLPPASLTFLELIAPLLAQALQNFVMEQRVREHEELYQVFINGNRDSCFLLSLDGCVLEVNEAAMESYQYTRDEFLRLSIHDIRVSKNERVIGNQIAHAEKTGIKFETQHKRKDGTTLPVEINAAGAWFRGQRVILSTVRDITDRKKIVDKLTSKNRELDQFAYMVSHDLKAPLRAVSNISTWIADELRELPVPDTIPSYLALLQRRTERMENFINGLLDYSRVGRIKHPVVKCDVKQLLEEIIEDIGVRPPFRIRVDGEMPILMTEVIKLRQVFANLLDNAVKHHNRPDGNVRITSEDAGEFYAFVVEDDGPGIEEQFHEQIFRLFQILESRDKQENTGVGLALVKKIVEEQGGTVHLQSRKGQGARFQFFWRKIG